MVYLDITNIVIEITVVKVGFKIGIYCMQVWIATARHGVTRKRSRTRLKA